MPIFKLAVENTARKRGSLEEMTEWRDICNEIKQEPEIQRLWNNYQKENNYALDISFDDLMTNLIEVGNYLKI